VLAGSGLLALHTHCACGAGLQAGVAKTDITPTLPVLMAGYESRKELSKGVHDPLAARAIVLEYEGKRLALVSVESLGFYNATAGPLRQAILERCGLQPSELFLCAIHTHSAPTLTLNAEKSHTNNVDYTRQLEGALAELVHTAMDHLAPAELGLGSGSSPVGVNRREVVHDQSGNAKVVLGRNPSVPIDREVQVLKVSRPGGKELVGLLFDFATHSTSLGAGNYLISGDIHGLAAQFVEQQLGSGSIVAPFAGPSGNIDPWYRVLPGFTTTNGWIPEPVLLGTMLGEEVVHVATSIKDSATAGPILSRLKAVELPRKPRSGATASTTAPEPFLITTARVGEVAFVGLSGEVFNEIGLAIKAASPFAHTIVLTHCNGACGYVPIRGAYPQGGYEVNASPFAEGADEILVDESLRLLRELRKEKD
jgi:hypothetical protein